MIKQFEIRRHFEEDEQISEAVGRVLSSKRYVKGPEVEVFEQEFAAFCGAKYCVAVNSGTSAIEVALEACGTKLSDSRVIVPGFTFPATAEYAAMRCKTLDVRDVYYSDRLIHFSEKVDEDRENLIVIPVHLFGLKCDVDVIYRRFPFAVIIEDACQAVGATDPVMGREPVAMGSCYSFFPSKNLGAIGEGGAIVTNVESFAMACRMYRDHGRKSKDDFYFLGYNRRMSEIIAAGLRVSLKYLGVAQAGRRRTAAIYMEGLKDLDSKGVIQLPFVPEGYEHVWHQFTVLVDDRVGFMRYLEENGIGTAIHYPYWLGQLESFRDFEIPKLVQCKVLSDTIVSLPMFSYMEAWEAEKVVDVIGSYFNPHRLGGFDEYRNVWLQAELHPSVS